MEIIFAQLIVSPAATEQRQIDVALSLCLFNKCLFNNFILKNDLYFCSRHFQLLSQQHSSSEQRNVNYLDRVGDVIEQGCTELFHLVGEFVELRVDRLPQPCNLPQSAGEFEGVAEGIGVRQAEIRRTRQCPA